VAPTAGTSTLAVANLPDDFADAGAVADTEELELAVALGEAASLLSGVLDGVVGGVSATGVGTGSGATVAAGCPVRITGVVSDRA